MPMLLALLLAQAAPDFCASVKDIVKSAPAEFERVRGRKHEDHLQWLLWTDPVKIAGAASCTVIEGDRLSGPEPSYACAIDVASPCDAMAKTFADVTRALQACFDRSPKLLESKAERDAVFHPSEVFVELAFFRGVRCSLVIEIEPPQNQYRSLPYTPMGMTIGPGK
ncbi:MAG: hypothetical protein LC689_16365 [Myxococcales bacterium]|nr:hypothetical protein [Myxococcales bacterium]